MAWNDFIGLSPQGSSVRSECVGGRRRARWRNVRSEREREGRTKEREERKEGRKKERKEGRKRSLYARVCLVVTRGASIQPVARLAHSFLHSYTLHAIWIDKQTTEANLSYWPGLALTDLVHGIFLRSFLVETSVTSPSIHRVVFSAKFFYLKKRILEKYGWYGETWRYFTANFCPTYEKSHRR